MVAMTRSMRDLNANARRVDYIVVQQLVRMVTRTSSMRNLNANARRVEYIVV